MATAKQQEAARLSRPVQHLSCVPPGQRTGSPGFSLPRAQVAGESPHGQAARCEPGCGPDACGTGDVGRGAQTRVAPRWARGGGRRLRGRPSAGVSRWERGRRAPGLGEPRGAPQALRPFLA
ncbi:hypothetical protein VULLAG_LOCUS23932 [Vulpes lagopus]